jgi:hypothetical protein
VVGDVVSIFSRVGGIGKEVIKEKEGWAEI